MLRSYDKRVVVLVGRLGEGWEKVVRDKDVVVFPISGGEFSKEELLKNSYRNLVRTAEHLTRLMSWR